MWSKRSTGLLSEVVSGPVIGAVAAMCTELALRGDIARLKGRQQCSMSIRMQERCDGSISGEKRGSRRDSQSAVSCRTPFDQTSDVTAKELEIGSRKVASDSWQRDVFNLTEPTFEESMCG